MTRLGKDNKIVHPGYGGASKLFSNRRDGFVFSDDLDIWMGGKGSYKKQRLNNGKKSV
jgi:hypothetical protein